MKKKKQLKQERKRLAHQEQLKRAMLNCEKREGSTYYEGWGWLTDKELFDLRQSDPRIAP